MRRSLLAVCALMLASATLSLADEWNRKIEVTFNGPVSIPAVHQPGWGVLPAGQYVFRIVNTKSDRHIVQIFRKDEKEVYATVLAIPNMRLEVTDKVVITFRETPAGQPVALRGMFYPGRNWGDEFVYAKVQATQLANVVNEPVLNMPAAMEKEEAKPESAEVIAELEAAPVTAIAPSGAEVETAEVVTPPPVVAMAAPAEELPQTASPLPLFALAGVLATMAGLGVRLAEKRLL
ncbi:MAG: hypothetical protein ABSB15_24860 [Bryobacteraceae bacterium]|jgi:hypothetical protein